SIWMTTTTAATTPWATTRVTTAMPPTIRSWWDPADLDTFIDGQRIYVYDLYAGGIGYSEVGYERYAEVLEETLAAVVDCPCEAGCPSCVLPGSTRVETYMEPSILEYPYPKEATRFLLHLLLGLAPHEPDLQPVSLPEPPAQLPPPELDPRTERKARKAARQLASRTLGGADALVEVAATTR
ncbi:MAG: DUF1998 domain-containing protein, partial [Planctomycetota bacterium]